jgi:hypothetical protein
VTPKQKLAQYIAARIALTGKTQREIAKEANIASKIFFRC